MAEEELDAEEQTATLAQQPGGARASQFVVLALVVLLGQGAIAYVVISRLVLPKQRALAGEEVQGGGGDAPSGPREPVPIHTPYLYDGLEEVLINPGDPTVLRFLSVKAALEMDSQKALDELLNNQVAAAKVEEVVYQVLASTPYSLMHDAKQRTELRHKIRRQINESGILAEGQVSAVYFERFLLQ